MQEVGTRWTWKEGNTHKWELWELHNLKSANIAMGLEFPLRHWKNQKHYSLSSLKESAQRSVTAPRQFYKDQLLMAEHTHIAGGQDLLEQPVEILLLGTQVALVLRLATELPVLHHLGIEVSICNKGKTHTCGFSCELRTRPKAAGQLTRLTDPGRVSGQCAGGSQSENSPRWTAPRSACSDALGCSQGSEAGIFLGALAAHLSGPPATLTSWQPQRRSQAKESKKQE